ncbi:LysR family transcriptional regulator [Actibacterium lipolyticum]|uniref:HTH-type transcriptional regulator GltC n=1 Tax=Actibacterium lipolyticum TaxID=1524263 RepID=A0A238L7K2_9RHOB|nr:LysR family transcriptional regulator [Actibacterium lipolyticum]SMX51083.1 HTH-type transcriptional regulator GltC [Actibacterium lipolyticum]
MDARQLRYFATVCRFKNLSHAADHCNVATSAISHHIANLEAELETKLFVRKPRGMVPTAAGIKLLDHANGILSAVDAAISDVKYGQSEISGHFAIGMPYSVIKVIGASLMRSVSEQYPKVRLLLREGLSGVTYATLTNREIQLALIFNPPQDPRTERVALLEEELFCMGHQSIIGATQSPITWDEMTQLPLFILQSGVLSRALVDKPGILATLEEKAQIQVASIAATQSALTERLGCTLAPKVLVSELLESGQLNARPILDPRPLRTLYMVTPAGAEPTQLSETITELTQRLVTDAVNNGQWHAAKTINSR